MTAAYPLHWPAGWKRTEPHRRTRGQFQVSPATARDHLLDQIRLMQGRYAVLSTNIALRRDGKPYAQQDRQADPGAAVYFQLGERQVVLACDRYSDVYANIRAIRKTLEAMRGIERWGASDMLERAFAGFEALPPPASCWETLDLSPDATSHEIQEAYRRKVFQVHPDAGGTAEAFAALTAARDAALEQVGAL